MLDCRYLTIFASKNQKMYHMKTIKGLLVLVLSLITLSLNAQTDNRKANISGVLYQLTFDIPENPSEKVTGKAIITFDLKTKQDVALDFQGSVGDVMVFKANKGKGKNAKVKTQNNQIVIPGKMFKPGTNKVTVDFTCQDKALTRKGDVVYTQVQADEGRSLFPCFDVEDMRAQYQTTLNVPAGWKSVTVDFSEMITPMNYMFVTGKFEEKTSNADGRNLRVFYSESNPDKVAQINQVFEQVTKSMKWMETYTGIKNPYEKECVIYILPSLDLGGLERRGSIALSDKAVFLDKKPSKEDLFKRAELIAHETSHIWFGNITAIDEPWAKEVLANFMASKITRSQFKKDEVEINFMNTYMKNAMALDRTEASHPVAWEVDNPHDPILFYDHINYCKAPVMMRMMEDEMGAEAMQKGLQQCLRDHYMGNVSWDKIVETLDAQAPGAGVRQFSDVWVKQNGMPIITCTYKNGDVVVSQIDPYGRGLCWRQKFEMKVISNLGQSQTIKVDMQQPTMTFKQKGGAPAFIIPNQDGRGYGRFTLDDHYVQTLPTRLIITRNDLNRYTLLNLIHDNYLQGKLAPSHFGELFRFLGREKNPMIMETAIDQMHKIASDLTLQQRYTLELVIMDLLGENKTKECRQLVLRKLGSSAISPEVLDKLQAIFDRHNEQVLDEHDYMEIAYRLAITRPDRRQAILEKERDRLISSGNDELRQEFDFVSKATHPNADARVEVFQSLLKPENRVNESWVLSALRLLNSDVFEPQSNVYLVEGLKALPEIQKTNSLSFPSRWTKTLIAPHKSAEAKTEIQKFLKNSPDFPANLKNYIYESSWILMNQIPYVDKTLRPTVTSAPAQNTSAKKKR